ncbi:MAG: HEAT repeat domain-containing protein [Acidobacteriota bacterium]|nr:HEAT repeat domain-containing protein [Acidobacteriota bacterium]
MPPHHRTSSIFPFALLLTSLLCPFLSSAALTQAPATPAAQATEDEASITPTDRMHSTAAQNTQEAWTMLTNAAGDTRHSDARIQALAALGTTGSSARQEKLISNAMSDPDVDVRTAAILAAGQAENRNLSGIIRSKLDDPEPQVAFVAATTLWKMHDQSGEDILIAVVDGERKATAGLRGSALHTVSRDLHSPSTLARIGALQGASFLLGPFGFGITAYEYMRKNGGDTSRVGAIELIAEQKTAPVRATLIAALGDKDPAVRATAAKAVGSSSHDKAASEALLPLFDDPKAPVRLTAAAAYIHSVETPASRETPHTPPRRRIQH